MSIVRWIRSINFFIAPIQESYISAETIINFTDSALLQGNADPGILILYNNFHPFKVAYALAHSIWGALKSINPSHTEGVVHLIDELTSTYARKWDVAVQYIYDSNSIQYKALLPHHRIDFNSGTLMSRYHAIENFISAMGTDASLATIKAEVTTFLALLTTAMANQDSQIVTIEKAIEALDAAGLDAADQLFVVYGGLITKFHKTPLSIETYFDVPKLQHVAASIFTALLKTTIPKKMCGRKMDIVKKMLKCTNLGTSIVYIYYTNGHNKLLLTGGLFIALLPNTTMTHDFIEAGYTATNHFLFAENMGTTPADLKIEIVAK